MFEVEKALSSVRSGISFSLLEPGGEPGVGCVVPLRIMDDLLLVARAWRVVKSDCWVTERVI